MRTFEGNVVAENNMRIGIVAARFNEFITSKLVAGAQEMCIRDSLLAVPALFTVQKRGNFYQEYLIDILAGRRYKGQRVTVHR